MTESSNLIFQKKSEIEGKFKETKVALSEFIEKKERFIKELDESRMNLENLTKDLALINVEIENNKETIERFIRDNPKLGLDEIDKKCKLVLGHFFDDLNENPESSEENKKKLSLKISYGKICISKKIEDESLTFFRLKQETRVQFDKNENDFFFADENDSVFLEELNVKQALFPLQNMNIKNYEPVIKVVERVKINFSDENSSSQENMNENSKLLKDKNKEEQRVQLGLKERVFKVLEKNRFEIIFLSCFLIFISTFIHGSTAFRRIGDFQAMIQSTWTDVPFATDVIVRNNSKQIISYINNSFYDKLGLANVSSLSFSNYVTKNLNTMRIAQTRYTKISCSYNRFNFSKTRQSCYDPKKLDYATYTNNGTNYYFSDTSIPGDGLLEGVLDEYNNSGYNATVNLANPVIFLKNMSFLKDTDWIDNNTKSILVTANFYNINYDCFVILRLLFENMGDYFTLIKDVGILDIVARDDSTYIVALTFGIICFILNIYSIYEPPEDNEQHESKYIHEDLNFLEKLKKFSRQIYEFVEKNCRKPNFYEIMSFANYLFFFGILIYKNWYFNMIPDNFIDVNSFNDLTYFHYHFEMITFLNCGCILLFLFTLIRHLAYWIDEIRIISVASLKYFSNILVFSIGFGVVFIIYSNYISYFIWGDYFQYYYKSYKFLFLKMLTMFFKGSIDNTDWDPQINRNRMSSDPFGADYYLFLLTKSTNPYLSVVNHSNYFTYFLFSIVYYFISNNIIKIVLTSSFLMSYRETEQEEIKNQKILALKKQNGR